MTCFRYFSLDPLDLQLLTPLMKQHRGFELEQGEIQYQDIVFVRNEEMYKNLPQKTLSIMRYAALAQPR